MKQVVLIIGHGSRSKEAQETFNTMVDMVREGSDFQVVEGAHMELCSPAIPEVVERVVQEGAKEIIMIPYFLYEGIHIREDIPEIIEELKSKYAGVSFKMGRPIGVEPLLSEILIKRAKEVC